MKHFPIETFSSVGGVAKKEVGVVIDVALRRRHRSYRGHIRQKNTTPNLRRSNLQVPGTSNQMRTCSQFLR